MKKNILIAIVGIGVLSLVGFLYLQCQQREKEKDKALIMSNQVLGALFDKRPTRVILKDMQSVEPIVFSVAEWLELGPGVADLKGWDDTTVRTEIQGGSDSFVALVREFVDKFSEEAEVRYREKNLGSTIEKLKDRNQKGQFTPLAELTDLYGIRLIFPTQDQVNEAVNTIESSYKIIEKKNYYKNPKPSGYRSVHLLIEKDGRVTEVQIRTSGMEVWGEWTHNSLYKGADRIVEKVGVDGFENIANYTIKMADYINSLELCEEAPPPPQPPELKVLWEVASEEDKKWLLPDGNPKIPALGVHCKVP